jgi:hypothetical protein
MAAKMRKWGETVLQNCSFVNQSPKQLTDFMRKHDAYE